jgi:GT2 family glycosyltransferase
MSTLIIMPTVPGNEEHLKEALDSLFQNTPQEYDLAIIKNNRIGFAAGVNRALKNFDAEHIEAVVILNDDVILYPFWLEQLQEVAKNGYDIVGDRNTAKPDEDHVVFYLAYIKKEVLQKIGILDENFKKGNWEDVDLCVRAIEAGFKIGKADDICCYHKGSLTINTMNLPKDNNKEYFKTKWKGTKYENRWN